MCVYEILKKSLRLYEIFYVFQKIATYQFQFLKFFALGQNQKKWIFVKSKDLRFGEA
jgi:hypothetical protein